MFQQPVGIEDPPSVPVQPSVSDNLVDQPPPRTTRIVDQFEEEPANANPRITIKHVKRTVTSEKKEGFLFTKNSNENRRAEEPQLTVTDLEKRRFGDKFGNRTGIKMWGFDHELNLWVVKRNSGNLEYYKSIHDFSSWTIVDLFELLMTPFYNPSQDPSAFTFKRFLEGQVKDNFPKMKTAKSLIRRDKEILDPETDEPMKIMLWLATNQLKEIPIPQHLHEGCLDDIDF